ncbi:nucleotidyltransferase domain-containing protein [Synechococcus sp. BSF8S]|nr:nucleotidyltransferase domain-containing protein [Synechococcus sp. BSF8S]MBC1262574.1 nucleotidyltransferase domain-containing protein [Synechococcus sp. BSA11S]
MQPCPLSTPPPTGMARSTRMVSMSTPVAPPIDARLQAMAEVIHGVIPGSEVRLFGSRAKGTAGPDSDIDLLITAPDAWLEGRNRFEVLNHLWGLLARADVSLDLLLYSERECEERRQWRSHVIGRALREGRLLDGAL